jgi:small subunit ribosomal protein S13e
MYTCTCSLAAFASNDYYSLFLIEFLFQCFLSGLAPEIPEDLYHLIKKAVNVRRHIERSRSDKDAKYRLILIESRIHRLARYYKQVQTLPPTWKYDSSTASAMVA